MSVARALACACVLPLAAVSPLAASCDCSSDSELRSAVTVVVAQVVALELPSLNEGDPDSPARKEEVEARLVIREALRGSARGAFRMGTRSMGMCQVNAPELGEWLVLALPDEPLAADSALGISYCTHLLTLGTRWNGWDEGTLRVRDALRDPSRPGFDAALEEYRRWPIAPSPPPCVPRQAEAVD
jgi:hypothetical protein